MSYNTREERTHSRVGRFQLRFGKHKFKNLRQVWSEDPYYCLSFLRYIAKYPKLERYINQQYCYDLAFYEANFDVRIARSPVTVILPNLLYYHKIRIYDCFDGKHSLFKNSVHTASSYPPFIKDYSFFSENEIFYDLLIRKHIANKCQNQMTFDRNVENNLSLFFGDERFLEIYRRDYQVYRDEKIDVMNILPNIFNLALLEKSIREGRVYYAQNEMINPTNILNVLSYINGIPKIYRAILNPSFDISSFTAEVDFIINKTIYDVKLSETKVELQIDDFFEVIFYAFGYYVISGIKIRRFVIYNPMLGLQHTLIINGLNFDKLKNFFEEVIFF